MIVGLKKWWLFFLAAVLLTLVMYIFYLNWKQSRHILTFAVLNVGQGDALFIESPTGAQVLIDAGPPRRILGELSRVMPAFDRSLDAIILTHPDQDHIGGFSEVLRNYKVKNVFDAGAYSDTKTYENLKKEIAEKNINVEIPRRGMNINLGAGANLQILFPDRDISMWTTNEASVIARLSYGENSFLLTGDATKQTEEVVLQNGDLVESDYLKVGHHGSKTSTSENFLLEVDPKYALLSLGKDNRYGHPHREVLDILESVGAKVLRTDEVGTIIFKCDRIDPCEIKKLRR